jgi:PAS domain S-box-containing protein
MLNYKYMASTTTDKSQALRPEPDYQTAIEQVTKSAIYLLDAQCRIVSWNLGAEALTGYSAEEVIGQPFFKFYLQKDQSAGKPMEMLHQAVRKGSIAEEGWRVRKNGTEFWAHIVTTALYDDQKKVSGFLKIVRNFNEYKRLDNQRISLVETTQHQKRTIIKQKSDIKGLEKQLQMALQKTQSAAKAKAK